MQIPPQINAEIPQEALFQGQKTIPKDKLGLFSKLLEGLLRNSKTDPRISGQTPEPEDPPLLPGEFPPVDGEPVLTKKANPRGAKIALFFREDEMIRKKEGPESPVKAAPAGKGEGEISPDKNTEGQDLAGEEAVFLLVPEKTPASLVPETGPELFSGEAETEASVLSGETDPAGPQPGVSLAAFQQEKPSRTVEERIFRDPADFAQETGPETVNLAPVSEKSPKDPEKTEPENPRRVESGSRDKRRGREVLEVRDLRTGQAGEVKNSPVFTGDAAGGIREVELRVELPGGRRSSGEGLSGGTTPSRAFEEVLAGELRGDLGNDIVRQASIILKDGGAGLIRLSLKPESLGNVKIRLEMAENKISGRIIVESNEALRAFEREIQSLEQAFKDSGFNGASIEMSVSSDNGKNPGNHQGKGEDSSPFFSERLQLAASGYESTGDFSGLSGNPGDPWSSRPLNMLV